MKKIRNIITRDLWIVLLDIIAVNASYFLALVVRFFVNSQMRPVASEQYVPAFLQFAPFYTVLSVVIFALWRLYGGMWRYAGINDMNRIILANLCTAIVHVLGTLLFVCRMPITYYVLGAVFQLICTAIIRYTYRFLVVEHRMIGKKAENALVIGSGDTCEYVIRSLENGVAYKPVAVISEENANTFCGLPVYSLNEIQKASDCFQTKAVFIAEEMEPQAREKITALCDQAGMVLRDYSQFFNFAGESDSVTGMADVVKGPSEGKRAIPFSPPDISESEISEVVEALKSGWITTGPRTKLLERRLAAFIETGKVDIDTEADVDRWKDRVVCLNSATAAEELNFRIWGIREGDEVIVPAYTYTASASAAIHCGATVRFVDIQKNGNPDTHMPEIDYDALEKAITEKTKAVVVVDLAGIVADFDRIFEIVQKKKALFTPVQSDGSPLSDLSARIQRAVGRIAVFADDAHSLGGSRIVGGKKLYCGAIADFTDFSFHAVKNFTTAEGGASTWKPIEGVSNAEIYKFYQLLSLHGQNKDALAKTKVGAWEYDIIGPWYKCNMTDIMAAIGLRQLDRYPSLLDRRVALIQKYSAVCDELGISHVEHHIPGMDSANHLFLIRLPGATEAKRNWFIEEMAKRGVSTNVHFKPLPMMTAYKNLGWNIHDFPNAYDYYQNLVTLPLHTLLTDEDVDFVCDNLRKVIKEL